MAQTPLPPAPGVAEVKMSYLIGNQIAQNVFHVHQDEPWSSDALDALTDQFATWEASDGAALRAVTCALVGIRATDLTAENSFYINRAVAPVILGERDSELLPANVTLAIQLSTGRRGRGEQGRIFWVGMTEDMTDGSSVSAAVVASMIAAMGNLQTLINGIGSQQLGILHRQNNGVALNPATFTPVLQFAVSDYTTDSQKNRLPNHRRHKRPTV